jgi:hypothetical protein
MVPIAKAHEKLVEDALRKLSLLTADVVTAKRA